MKVFRSDMGRVCSHVFVGVQNRALRLPGDGGPLRPHRGGVVGRYHRQHPADEQQRGGDGGVQQGRPAQLAQGEELGVTTRLASALSGSAFSWGCIMGATGGITAGCMSCTKPFQRFVKKQGMVWNVPGHFELV